MRCIFFYEDGACNYINFTDAREVFWGDEGVFGGRLKHSDIAVNIGLWNKGI